MARYLVVKAKEIETEYDTRYVVGETIDLADTVELTPAEKEQMPSYFRCLEIVGPDAVRQAIRKEAEDARKRVKAQEAYTARQKAATAKRKATLTQRKLEAAKKLLAEAGHKAE